DAGRAQVVDERLVGLVVAGRAEEPAAQAHVDRGTGVLGTQGIDTLEGGEDIGRVRSDARWRRAAGEAPVGRGGDWERPDPGPQPCRRRWAGHYPAGPACESCLPSPA